MIEKAKVKMEKKNIGLSYGVLYPTLKQQIKKQGYKLENSVLLEKLRFSINMCKMHNLASESIIDKMFKKLHKKVVNSILDK